MTWHVSLQSSCCLTLARHLLPSDNRPPDDVGWMVLHTQPIPNRSGKVGRHAARACSGAAAPIDGAVGQHQLPALSLQDHLIDCLQQEAAASAAFEFAGRSKIVQVIWIDFFK